MIFYSKNILQSIANEVRQYTQYNKGKTPTYIIINNTDSTFLLTEMVKAKLIPNNTPSKKLDLYGLRVIRTNDIPEGYFDIVGS